MQTSVKTTYNVAIKETLNVTKVGQLTLTGSNLLNCHVTIEIGTPALVLNAEQKNANVLQLSERWYESEDIATNEWYWLDLRRVQQRYQHRSAGLTERSIITVRVRKMLPM